MQVRTAARRRARGLPPWVWTIATTLVLLLASGTAAAQLSVQGIVDRTHNHEGYRYWISRADCESNDDFFTFAFNVQPPNRVLEVWVSDTSDCTLYEHRNPTGATKICNKIPVDVSTDKNPITIRLKSRDIATAVPSVQPDCTDTTGQTAGRAIKIAFLYLASPTENVGSGNAAIFPDSYQNIVNGMSIDLLGPNPPAGVKATPAEAGLTVELIDATANVGDLGGYYIYCDPPPTSLAEDSGGCGCIGAGLEGGGGGTTSTNTVTTTTTTTLTVPPPPGGTTGAGGAGGGGGAGGATGAGGMGGTTTTTTTDPTTTTTTTDPMTTTSGEGGAGGTGGTGDAGGSAACSSPAEDNCQSCLLTPGEAPQEAYRCGQITTSGTSGVAAILANDVTHAVGVAAFDLRGNVGELSTLACATPTEVSDFYESYKQAGGKGGGGCSIGTRLRSPGAAAPLLVLGGALAFGLRRRKRANAAATSTEGTR